MTAQPYLRFGCTEFNGAQTFAYLGCGSSDSRIRVLEEPCFRLYEDPDTGDVRVWTDPQADGAPWFDAAFPESSDFLGIYILNITGTDSPLQRQVDPRTGGMGGAVFGPLRAKPRILGFSAVAFARSESAMEYGMRWLTDVFQGDHESPCTPCDAEIMLACSENGDDRWTVRSVGLVEGPVWGETPVAGLGCLMRTANWAMASQHPHLFKCPTTVLSPSTLYNAGACSPIEDWLSVTETVSADITSLPNIGETCGVVTITAGDNEITARITGRARGAATLPSFDTSTTSDPSAIFDFYVTIPQSSTIVYDGSTQRVSIIMPGGIEMDGMRYVEVPSGETLSWPIIRCGTIELNVSVPLHDLSETTLVSVESVYRSL
jgi:hypothetical protein